MPIWSGSMFRQVAQFLQTSSRDPCAPTAGVSVRNNYDVNSLAVPRKAKEAIGAIALLKNESTVSPSHTRRDVSSC